MTLNKLILVFTCLFCHHIMAQQGFSSAGGDFSSTDGSVSISVGQPFFNTNTGVTGSETQGVEQPCTVILTQPSPQGVCVGANASFSVTVSGPASFQWKRNGINVGTNSNTLTINNVAFSDSGNYQVFVFGLCGTITSQVVKLSVGVNLTPLITVSTSSTTVFAGLGVPFSAALTNGGSNPSYQWYRNSTPVGTNSSAFVSNNLNNGDTVYCVLSGANNVCQTGSTAISNKLVMTVIALTPPDTIPFRINSNLLDSFNNTGVVSSGYPGCNGGNADDDKFFIVIKPANITSMNVVLEGYANFDGQFEVLTGNSIFNFVSLGCVNNMSNLTNQKESQLFTGLPTAATTYLIRVFDSRIGNGGGAFKIGVHHYTNIVGNNIPCAAINGSNNTAKIFGSPTLLTAYDNGVFGGSNTNLLNEPPYGPNLAYWEGTTAFAPFVTGAPLPACGTSSPAPRRVWYTFFVPGMDQVNVVFRSKYGATSKNTILEAISTSGSPCPITFNSIKCSNTGTLTLTSADMAPYVGQKLLIQITEDGGTNTGMNFMLAVQGVAPAITASNINTNGFTVNLPSTAPTNLTKYRIYYRIQGSTGASFFDVPASSTSSTVSSLTSGATYDVWVGYYNSVNTAQIYFSEKITVTTSIGCSGVLPAPTVVLPAAGTTCTKATITWPSFIGASSAFKYRFYYRKAPSIGYNVLALNDTFVNLTGLALSSNYEFYYKAICASSVALSSVASLYTNCSTPKKEDKVLPAGTKIVINGKDLTNADFRDLVNATEDNIPADGEWHQWELNQENKIADNLIVYPNPASEWLNVQMETSVTSYNMMSLYTAEGRTVWQKEIDASHGILLSDDLISIHERIDVSHLASGMYLLKVLRNGVVTSKTVFIKP